MSEYVFTYKVTVKATRTHGDGKFAEGELETEVRDLLDELNSETVYVDNEDDEEIAFDTAWTIELS